MSITRNFILLAALVLIFGCATPDPLAGWQICFDTDPKKLDKAIQADYQDYIQKLPQVEKSSAGYEFDFENGTGQHAVRIITAVRGTYTTYDLIYDKNNKRVKVIKYSSGHYAS